MFHIAVLNYQTDSMEDGDITNLTYGDLINKSNKNGDSGDRPEISQSMSSNRGLEGLGIGEM